MTARLFVVRHGNTFDPDEAPRRIGSRTDLPLSGSGRDQADRLGRWFASEAVGFVRAWCGPLRRLTATAQAIMAHQAIARPVVEAAWLAEVDHGPDENRPEEEVRRRLGTDALLAWDRDAVPPPGWLVNAPARIEAWRRLSSELPDGDALAVTSNGMARFALELVDADRRPAVRRLRTGAFGLLERRSGGSWRSTAWDVRP